MSEEFLIKWPVFLIGGENAVVEPGGVGWIGFHGKPTFFTLKMGGVDCVAAFTDEDQVRRFRKAQRVSSKAKNIQFNSLEHLVGFLKSIPFPNTSTLAFDPGTNTATKITVLELKSRLRKEQDGKPGDSAGE